MPAEQVTHPRPHPDEGKRFWLILIMNWTSKPCPGRPSPSRGGWVEVHGFRSTHWKDSEFMTRLLLREQDRWNHARRMSANFANQAVGTKSLSTQDNTSVSWAVSQQSPGYLLEAETGHQGVRCWRWNLWFGEEVMRTLCKVKKNMELGRRAQSHQWCIHTSATESSSPSTHWGTASRWLLQQLHITWGPGPGVNLPCRLEVLLLLGSTVSDNDTEAFGTLSQGGFWRRWEPDHFQEMALSLQYPQESLKVWSHSHQPKLPHLGSGSSHPPRSTQHHTREGASLSGSIIPIRLHHPHLAPSSPSGSIISAPSPPSGSITSIQLHHLHHLHLAPSSSIGLHHPHQALSPPSSSIIPIGLHQTASSPLGSITSIGLHQAQQLQSLKGESVTWLWENSVTQSGQRTLYPLGELGSFWPQLNCVRLNHDSIPVFVWKFTVVKRGAWIPNQAKTNSGAFHTVSTQHSPKFPSLDASRLGLATREVCEWPGRQTGKQLPVHGQVKRLLGMQLCGAMVQPLMQGPCVGRWEAEEVSSNLPCPQASPSSPWWQLAL